MGLVISQLSVRRSAFIDAAPVRIWKEFATEDRIKAWFGRGHTLHTFETRLAGRVEMSVEHDFGIGPEHGLRRRRKKETASVPAKTMCSHFLVVRLIAIFFFKTYMPAYGLSGGTNIMIFKH